MIRRAWLLLAASVALTTAAGAAYRIEVTVNIGGGRWQVTSDATTTLFDLSNAIRYSAYIGHRHSLYTTNSTQNQYPTGFGKIQTFLTSTAQLGQPLPDGCNYAEVFGQSYDSEFPAASQTKRTTNLCWTTPAPPPRNDPPPTVSCDGGTCYGSPIVIAIDGPYEFTGVTDGVRFDLDGDGRLDRVAWPRDGSIAFLFFDRNGNGTPDDGRELFGDHTLLRSGERAVHGFQALAEFDSNGDGAVTGDDDRWTQLQLWRDFDHDGTAGTGEITPVAGGGIRELGFDCRLVGRRDAQGNVLRWQAFTVLAHGRRPYYDVFLLNMPG